MGLIVLSSLCVVVGSCGVETTASDRGDDASASTQDGCRSGDGNCSAPNNAMNPGQCSLGALRCVDGFEQECGANGIWLNSSSRGMCEIDECALARQNRSYIGCGYWALDLDNAVEVRGPALDLVGVANSSRTCDELRPGAISRSVEVCWNATAEDVDNDGQLDVAEDSNGNGQLDPGEDRDGDGNLDVMEDRNNNGQIDGGILGPCATTSPQCPGVFVCTPREVCVIEGLCSSGQMDNEDMVLVTDTPVCALGQYRLGLCDGDGQCPMNFSCEPAPTCVTDAQHSPFAIVVSNPSNERHVEVTVTAPNGWIGTETVEPNAVKQIFPRDYGWDDYSIDHTGVSRTAYRVTSNGPIVAYQFNPLDNVGVFSNDGSLLLPEHAFDTVYFVLGYQSISRRPANHDYNGYVTIVASAEGTTTLEVTPTVDIRAGTTQAALSAGVTQRFSLEQGDVLNLEANVGGDLTGTKIASTDGRAFGVFVGHEAMALSPPGRSGLSPRPCCADHVEEQLFPASTWGRSFAVARSFERADAALAGTSVPDMLRILAQKDGTQIAMEPRPESGRCPELQAMEFCDVFIHRDTVVSSNQPILVGHFLTSTETESQFGDPALAFEPPSEQFRSDYTILVPQQYEANYMSVVSPAGATVSLDGQDVTDQLLPFQQSDDASNRFAGGRIALSPGPHRVECPAGCGVLVYGFSDAVSYLFAGGLDLRQITAP